MKSEANDRSFTRSRRCVEGPLDLRCNTKSSRTADVLAAHLLATMDRRTGCALAQARVPAGTNEHKAALALLEATVLWCRVITGDAVSCQRDLCRQVVANASRYLIKVDDNRPTLKADIATAAEPASPSRSAGDVTMGEDANRTLVGLGPRGLAALRNLAISKLR
jgi:predicted transposase YbfD/YdcC